MTVFSFFPQALSGDTDAIAYLFRTAQPLRDDHVTTIDESDADSPESEASMREALAEGRLVVVRNVTSVSSKWRGLKMDVNDRKIQQLCNLEGQLQAQGEPSPPPHPRSTTQARPISDRSLWPKRS